MTHQEDLISLLLLFHYFMMLVWPCILLDRESSCRWILRTSSSQCYNNPVLVPPCKPPNHVKYFYDGQTYDLRLWMWFQWSMERLLRHFTWQCGYFSLLIWCHVTYKPLVVRLTCHSMYWLHTKSYNQIEARRRWPLWLSSLFCKT